MCPGEELSSVKLFFKFRIAEKGFVGKFEAFRVSRARARVSPATIIAISSQLRRSSDGFDFEFCDSYRMFLKELITVT